MHLADAEVVDATVPMNISAPRPETNAALMASDLMVHLFVRPAVKTVLRQ
jgi:hypothetical protein